MKILLIFSFIAALLSWLLPNHYLPWLGAYQNFSAFIALTLCYFWVSFKTPVTTSRNQSLIFLLFLVIFSLQFISGITYYAGEVLVFSLYVLGFFIALSISQSLHAQSIWYQSLCKGLAAVFLLAAILSTWIALKQWLLLSGSIWVADLRPNARPFANLGQPNSLATLLGMGLAATLYFYEKHILQRAVASVLVLFLLFGLVLTQSRTPWLTGIAICIFWSWKVHKLPTSQKNTSTDAVLLNSSQLRLSAKAVFSWYGVFILLTLALPYINDAIGMQGTGVIERAQQMQRWEMYKQFALAVYHGPWYGYGIGNVAAAQVAITPVYPLAMLSFFTHNILLDILIWFGPVIGGVIIFLCTVWLWRLGQAAKSKESLFALVAAGFILTHSMLEYPHAYAFFFLPLGVLLGIAQNEVASINRITIPKPAAFSLIAILTVLGSWVMYEYLIIEDDFRLMRFETANIGTIKAEKKAPDVILLTQLREYTRLARTPATAGMSDTDLDWMRQVAHRYPYATSLSRYIYALALNNKLTEAQHQLIVLKGLHKPEHYIAVIAGLRYYAKEHPYIQTLLNSIESPSEQ